MTEAIRRKPYSVLLLDEIEKAHPQIFNTFLQILDDGRLTDSKGVCVDFCNTVIILTSNLGSQHLLEAVESKVGINEAVKEKVMKKVREFFRPEFLNRLDDICFFSPLTTNQLSKIVRMQMIGLQDRLKEQEIQLQTSDAACEAILKQAAPNPAYGARPIKRFIEKNITTDISRLLISGKLEQNSLVKIDADPSGKLSFVSIPLPKRATSGNDNDTMRKSNNKKFKGMADDDDEDQERMDL